MSVIDTLQAQLQLQINQLDQQIKTTPIDSLKQALLNSSAQLQALYAQLIAGSVTDAQVAQIQAAMDTAKESSLAANARMDKIKMVMILVGAIAVIGAVIIWHKSVHR